MLAVSCSVAEITSLKTVGDKLRLVESFALLGDWWTYVGRRTEDSGDTGSTLVKVGPARKGSVIISSPLENNDIIVCQVPIKAELVLTWEFFLVKRRRLNSCCWNCSILWLFPLSSGNTALLFVELLWTKILTSWQ